jgi:hypothetical protein
VIYCANPARIGKQRAAPPMTDAKKAGPRERPGLFCAGPGTTA